MHNQEQIQALEYRTRRKGVGLEAALLIISGVATAMIATIAMAALLPGTGVWAWLKIGLIGVMAGVVSYAVNRFAIDRGAPLAATGYVSAGLASVGTILFVGAGLFASTFAGLTLASVDELRLQQYGRELTRYVGSVNEGTSQATRTLPVIRAVASDLRGKVDCEIRSACLSGREGGRGPVTKALEIVAARADQIAATLGQGDQERRAIIERLNDLLGEYQGVLGDSNRSLDARRAELIGIDAKIDQALSDLAEAMPTTLLQAYVGELQAGISIVDRPNATNAANRVLAGHGRTLAAVLETLEISETVRPSFPPEAGVSSTFAYLGHFLPIAAITAVVELILPLALWVYAFIGIAWEKELRVKQAAQRNLAKPEAARAEAAQPEEAAKDNANVTRLETTGKNGGGRRSRRSGRHGGAAASAKKEGA
ncbi:hypothetical protein B7H23_01285 [Notoacmeibacter marinus]|uniref:DUF4407 domain-containing protein n=1 Tax=Notoacmeibacter marinus TaxID=1876515 RepID=A0A231V093_9HYPH|nr:hypothetical protein B7H23_01285 [Notoacmeibacter marinus]